MIVVQAVLVPHGDMAKPKTRLCQVHIINDGTGTRNKMNYDVELYSRGDKPRIIRRARIENYKDRSLPAWRLIARAFAVLEI